MGKGPVGRWGVILEIFTVRGQSHFTMGGWWGVITNCLVIMKSRVLTETLRNYEISLYIFLKVNLSSVSGVFPINPIWWGFISTQVLRQSHDILTSVGTSELRYGRA